MHKALAIFGGKAVRRYPWPRWPRFERSTREVLFAVLRSGRWTISGPNQGALPFERQFADAFSEFNGVPYCVPTANGSAALTIALEALGIGPGKEVLVPGLTWVACASAVARIGGIPILVDIDPSTLCMSVSEARKSITPQTAAILLVHSYCTVADLASFSALAEEIGVPLIEDCSHAHGALWNHKRVGSIGTLGVFSMQQTKVLTAGEGGAVLAKDPEIYDQLQQLRADGRRYASSNFIGSQGLEIGGLVQGHNYCLSEFQSAILFDKLQLLDQENDCRLSNALELTMLLRKLNGAIVTYIDTKSTRPTIYRYCLTFKVDAFCEVTPDYIARALSAELGITCETVYDPLNRNPLYDPRRSPRRAKLNLDIYNPARFELPGAHTIRNSCLTIPHYAFLGKARDMKDIANAIEKLLDNAALLSKSTEGDRHD